MDVHELRGKIAQIAPKSKRLTIGIDGAGGAGKSTLAEALQKTISGAVVIHADDFYKPQRERRHNVDASPVNTDFDWDRFEREVVIPLESDRDFSYQIYDWNKDTLADFVNVPAACPVIIEGGYVLQKRFFPIYDFSIFVETSREARLKRAISRDGEHMRAVWENEWMPADERYQLLEEPHKRASAVVRGE